MQTKTLLLATSLLLSGLTFAQDKQHPPKTPPSPEKIMKDLDEDKDGLISYKEAKGPLKDDFKKIDMNQDGFISKVELEKAPKPKNPPKQGSNPQK